MEQDSPSNRDSDQPQPTGPSETPEERIRRRLEDVVDRERNIRRAFDLGLDQYNAASTAEERETALKNLERMSQVRQEFQADFPTPPPEETDE